MTYCFSSFQNSDSTRKIENRFVFETTTHRVFQIICRGILIIL
ncbi:MAG: hypothetical protein OJF59_001380 [Cytophagales bacterium]|nr:MAG: hypothetical protein OJF59_001380 [Cytophagales bacterium]